MFSYMFNIFETGKNTHFSIASRCSKHSETGPQFEVTVKDAPVCIPQSMWYRRVQNFKVESLPVSRQQPMCAPPHFQYTHVCTMYIHIKMFYYDKNTKKNYKWMKKKIHTNALARFPSVRIKRELTPPIPSLMFLSTSSGITGLKITQL